MMRTAGALALLAICSLAQTPAPADAIIRTTTHLIEVSAVVHDKNGPVSSLTKDDFIVTDRGRQQNISVFFVESAMDAAQVKALPQGTFSNRLDAGSAQPASVTIVLLDTVNTKFEDNAYAKRQFIKFLSGINPKQRIAVYVLGKTLRVLCDFTDDPELLHNILAGQRQTLSGLDGGLEPSLADTGNKVLDSLIDHANEKVAGTVLADHAEKTAAALQSIIHHVANIPGRKNLVWVTGGLPFSFGGAANALNDANVAVYPVDARGLVGMPVQLTASAAGPSRSGGPPQTVSFSPGGMAAMQEIAERTGGHAFYNTNDLTNAIRMAVDDSAVTYTLGFYAGSDSLDGKFHELKVLVKRGGLNVRYRKGYAAPLASSDRRTAGEMYQRNVQAALLSPLESSSIPFTARLERVNQPKPDSLKIRCSLDIRDLQVRRDGDRWRVAAEVYMVQADLAGNILDGSHDMYNLDLTKEKYEDYLKVGVNLSGVVERRDGFATLRIVVVDRGSAAVGSLIVPASRIK